MSLSRAALLLQEHLPSPSACRQFDRPLTRSRLSRGEGETRHGLVLASSVGTMNEHGNIEPEFPIPNLIHAPPTELSDEEIREPRWVLVLLRDGAPGTRLHLWTRLRGDKHGWIFFDDLIVDLAWIDRHRLAHPALERLRAILQTSATRAAARAASLQKAYLDLEAACRGTGASDDAT